MQKEVCLLIAILCIANATAGPIASAPAASDIAMQTYAQCSGCHGAQLQGGQFGPPLKGQSFTAKWATRHNELLQFIKSAMPPSNPGSLSDSDCLALVTLIAASNAGLEATVSTPAGSSQTEATARVAEGHVGPQRAAKEVFRDELFRRETNRRRVLLESLTDVTDDMLRHPPARDWLSWRRTQDAAGFSPLTRISKRSVARLSVRWSWSLPKGSNESAPIVHDGILFINSSNEVQALEADTGDLLWKYRRPLDREYQGSVNTVQRSLAIYGPNIYVATADRHVVALDSKSGVVAWDQEIVPPALRGVILSSGPFVAGGVVIQGTSLGPACRGGCYVVGLDAKSGKQLWRFNTVAQPGEPGGDSWNGLPAEERSGAASWIPGSYDPYLDLVYFGTGGTYGISTLLVPRDSGGARDNDALYTNSTIALHPRTGTLAWAHQHFSRELWDLDEVFERILVTLPVAGRDRRLAVTIGKVGILDAVDRADGRYVFSKDLGLNNLIQAIDRTSGRRTVYSDRVPTPNSPVSVCPSAEGARNWMAGSYNPNTHALFLPMQETCMDLTWDSTQATAASRGSLDIGWTLKPPEGSDGLYGRVEAIDLVSRKVLWFVRTRALAASSVLSTAGGLVFCGTSDRWFRAMDDRTGRLLWQARLNATPNSTPVSFEVAGHQYIAITAGGGGAHDIDTAELTPEVVSGEPSTTLWVFGLE